VAGNLSDLLKKNISSAQLDLIQRVADEASLLGLPIYIVGGFVRDCCWIIRVLILIWWLKATPSGWRILWLPNMAAR